jgi:hypothetical protein
VADQDHLATNRGWVGGSGFSDGSLEDEGSWWEELSDGAGDGEAFTFGLPGALYAEVVHASGSKCKCDVNNAVAEGAPDVEGTRLEVRVDPARV